VHVFKRWLNTIIKAPNLDFIALSRSDLVAVLMDLQLYNGRPSLINISFDLLND
jgi:hypothetical protein